MTDAQGVRLARLMSSDTAIEAFLGWWEGLVAPKPPPPVPGRAIQVSGDDNLQRAVDEARPGDTLLLASGSTWIGPLTLPRKDGDAWITIRTDATFAKEENRRARPMDAPWLPSILAPLSIGAPAIRTEPGAHHYRLLGLSIRPASDGICNDLILLGDGSEQQTALGQMPHDLMLDRCLIQGLSGGECKRGIALNASNVSITGCHISDIKRQGQDAQAICGWNGPGPFVIENNYLEASGENLLFGGSDPWIEGLVPSDITIRGNHIAKPLAWRGEPGSGPSAWTVKNLLELKNARRVVIENNLMENNWAQAQAGYGIVFTAVNQDGRAPWSCVEDVTFRNNVLRHSGGGFNLYGGDAGGARRIRIENNLCTDLDAGTWGGEGAFLQVAEVDDLTVTRNTAQQSGNIVKVYGKESKGFAFMGNLMPHNAYGVLGSDSAVGTPTLETFFPGYLFEDNAFFVSENWPAHVKYPVRTYAPPSPDVAFVDWRNGDFRVKPSSGSNYAGCDFTKLAAAFAAAGEE